MASFPSSSPRRALALVASEPPVSACSPPDSRAPRPPRASAQAASSAATGKFLKLWSAEWMAGQKSFTTAQAQDLARRMSVIVAMRGKFTKHRGDEGSQSGA